MKLAQDFLKETASGEVRGGFNSRLQGYSLLETVDGVPQGHRWGERCHGWGLADEMISQGEIFSQTKEGIEFKCYADGDAFCCIGPGFINLQESNNFVFADTWQEAADKYVLEQTK